MGNGMSSSISAVQLPTEGEMKTLSQLTAATASNEVDESAGDSNSFSDALKQAIRGVDDQPRAASDRMAAVDSGNCDDLVGAMLTSQTARLFFSMLMQMRNKIACSMDELIKLSL